MSRKDKSRHQSRHHIIPRSRGGDNSLENISRVHIKKHQAYHTMFDNRTPTEIVENLVRKYWNGNWDYVKEAYERSKVV